ncbi:MAG: pantoate--beta-alanine ligase [Candidatus Scalinduaceae bacterium]
MDVITKIDEMSAKVISIKERKESIGFVPTMGALHEGHLNLIQNARDENNRLIVSIFVNPTQFDESEDFNSYPRQSDKDVEIAASVNVDVIFVPSTEELYPEGFCTNVVQNKLTETLCGRSRPGHFRGVTTIVTKLFNIIRPDRVYFGQKDYQQSVVVKRLVRDLNMEIDVKVLPTIREKDGLAFSSRNKRLNSEERLGAVCLYNSLLKAKTMVALKEKSTKKIIEEMVSIINSAEHNKIDYVSIVDPDTLDNVSWIDGKVVAVVAVWIGATRLIDNMILE